MDGQVDQLEDRLLRKQEAAGSNPVLSMVVYATERGCTVAAEAAGSEARRRPSRGRRAGERSEAARSQIPSCPLFRTTAPVV